LGDTVVTPARCQSLKGFVLRGFCIAVGAQQSMVDTAAPSLWHLVGRSRAKQLLTALRMGYNDSCRSSLHKNRK
jgi:hypothetical protein